MAERHSVTYSFGVDITKARADAILLEEAFNKLEATALRYLALVNKMRLPDDVQMVIDTMARAAMVFKQAEFAARSFAMAQGPVGWAFAGATFALTALSAGDLIMDLG